MSDIIKDSKKPYILLPVQCPLFCQSPLSFSRARTFLQSLDSSAAAAAQSMKARDLSRSLLFYELQTRSSEGRKEGKKEEDRFAL